MRRLLVVLLVAASALLVVRGTVPCDALAVQPRCYVSLHPGPTEDTLRILEVSGRRTYSSAGALLLTTVAVDDQLDLREWVRGAFSPREMQVRRELLYPPDTDVEVVRRRNVADMDRSQIVAAAAGLAAAGYPVDLDPRGAEVIETEPGMPADGVLEVGDVVVAVGGRDVDDATAAADAVATYPPGEPIPLTVERDDERIEVELTAAADPVDPAAPVIGALLADHLVLPVDVSFDAGPVGGPSAGLMFAIAVVDVLAPEDLTGGAVIAGTGTIDVDGNIGAIGGIRQKILGAVERGDAPPATVFLVPARNLEEARGTPVEQGVLLVPVATLEDALDALQDLRDGDRPVDAVALGPSG